MLGIVGINFFIQQWWFADILPRVNGFSYEPSYYATYMLIGWTIIFVLLIKEVHVLSSKTTKWIFTLITVSILLSSSRMGILFMIAELLLFFSGVYLKTAIQFKIKRSLLYYSAGFAVCSLVGVIIIIPLIMNEYIFLLQGTGVAGQSSHSVGRFNGMKILWEIFLSHPFTGTSLGGIPSAIGEYIGMPVVLVKDAKLLEGMNIFLEILVASGLIGFIFFMLYIINLFYAATRIAKKLQSTSKKHSNIMLALTLALFVELLILCFNQNILRLYVWILISMLNAAFFNFRDYQKSTTASKIDRESIN